MSPIVAILPIVTFVVLLLLTDILWAFAGAIIDAVVIAVINRPRSRSAGS
jgi:hypothetical protein